ncbi:MAG: hypothetical protein VYE73_13840, partial [Acidobacteriota bacterium]|nr:hypothetical protein [Acidobacteriota bacterium]
DPSASRSASFFVFSGLVGLGLVWVLYITSQTETAQASRYKLDRQGALETVSEQTAGPAKNPLDPLSAEALERLVASLTVSGAEVSHLRPLVFAHLGLAVAGLIVLARRRASAAWVLAAFVALPVASGIAALAGVGHWYSPRYTSYALPPLLVLVGVGTAALGEAFGSLVSRWAPQVAGKAAGGALALGLALPLAAANWRAATSEPFAAYDWRTPARFLERYANEGETILAKDFWSKRALGHYLGGRRGLSVDTAGGLEEAKRRARDCGACWLVIGGVDPRRLDVRNWMSGHYRLMSDGREDFGLFFYPDHRTFLATHFDGVVGEEMTEYFRARRRLEMGGDERFFIGDGWSFEERDGSTSFRWAAARAEVALVADEAVDSVLRFRARRFPHPEAPSQHVEVRLGDRPLATVELVDEWRDYSIYAPASALSPGIVFTTFVFSSNARPDDVLDGSNDRRELSAAFDYLDLRPLHGMPSPATPQPPKE